MARLRGGGRPGAVTTSFTAHLQDLDLEPFGRIALGHVHARQALSDPCERRPACIRVGNAVPRVPVSANLVCLATPALAVLWLALDGWAIPRVGPYVAGAVLVTAALAVAQMPERLAVRSASGCGGSQP